MNISRKRILSVLAAAALSMSALPQTMPLLSPALTACAEDTVPEDLAYEISADGTSVTIKKWNGSDTELIIPEKIKGLPVTEIGSWSFFDCKTIESITLPGSIRTIGSNAFNGCIALKSIALSKGLNLLDSGAFTGCISLESISIPDTVTSIGTGTFSSCSALESITIPSSVSSIGGNAFSDTAWLNNMKADNPLVIINSILIDGTAASGSIDIPDSVKVIGDMAFSNCRTMTDISIPEGVTSIGENAFYNCTGLTSVSVPDGVQKIGYQAFNGCAGLTEVFLPDSVTDIGGSTFFGCEKLETVKLPESITLISNSMFTSCKALRAVTIPESVTRIDPRAFLGCSSLTEIVIPEGVTNIGFQAFALCSNLKEIKLPDSLTYIDRSAFSLCPDLTISANDDSYAENYADQNGFAFSNLQAGEFTDVSLTLSDDLGINFFVSGVTDAEATDYRVTFSGICDENSSAVSLSKKQGVYCATANVSADHMDEKITAVLERSSDEGWEQAGKYTYSVNKYLKNVDTSSNEVLAELVSATKTYGEVTKAYFNDSTMPSVADCSDKYYTDDFKPVKGADDALSLVLNSKLAARLYIKDLPADASASYGTKELKAKKSSNGSYYFEVADINPTALASDISIKYGTTKYSFKPLSWSYLVKKNGIEGKNKAMADALYQYCAIAEAYKSAF